MARTSCPDCGAFITASNPRDGARLICANCGEELEVTSTKPFAVSYYWDWADDHGWDEMDAGDWYEADGDDSRLASKPWRDTRSRGARHAML